MNHVSSFNDDFVEKSSGVTNPDDLMIFQYDYRPDYIKIRVIERLYRFYQIRELSLIGHEISVLDGLVVLTKLRKVNLSWNNITDFIPLTRMKSLQKIILNHNQITHIPMSISALHNLKFLSLRLNPIKLPEEIDNLTQNLDLRHLDIEGTPIGRDEKIIYYCIIKLPMLNTINRMNISLNMKRKSLESMSIQVVEPTVQLYSDMSADQITQLQKEINSLKFENSTYQIELATAKQKLRNIDELSADYQQMVQLLKRSNSKIELLERRLKDYGIPIGSVTVLTDNFKLEPDKLSEVHLLQDTLKMSVLENAQLKARVSTFDTLQLDASRVISKVQEDFKNKEHKLLDSLVQAENDIEKYLKEIERLKSLLKEKTIISLNVDKDNKKLTDFVLLAEGNVHKLEDEVNTLRNTLAEREDYICKIQRVHSKEVAKYRERLKKVKGIALPQMQQMYSEMIQVKEENKKNDYMKKLNQRKIERLSEFYDNLKMKYNVLSEQNEDLTKQLEMNEKLIGELEMKTENMEHYRKSSDHVFNKLALKYNGLQKDLTCLVDHSVENERLNTKIEDMEKQIQNLQDKVNTLNKHAARKNREYADLKLRYDNLDVDREELCSKCSSLQHELNSLQEYSAPIERFNNMMMNLDEANAKVTELNKQISNLTQQLYEEKQNNFHLQNLIGSRVNEIGDITTELNIVNGNDFVRITNLLQQIRKDVVDNSHNLLSMPDKFRLLEDGINDMLSVLHQPKMPKLYTQPLLRPYSSHIVTFIPEHDIFVKKLSRITNEIKSQLMMFPGMSSAFTDDLPKTIEGQLEQVSQMIRTLKELFDERERNVEELTRVNDSQHSGVQSVSQNIFDFDPSYSTELNAEKTESVTETEKSPDFDSD